MLSQYSEVFELSHFKCLQNLCKLTHIQSISMFFFPFRFSVSYSLINMFRFIVIFILLSTKIICLMIQKCYGNEHI